MGGNGTFLASGGFSRQEFITTKRLADIKVVKNPKSPNASLPLYSNTPNTAYLHEDTKVHINQIRFYRNRKVKYDIDWGHGHGDLPKGEPHIHIWVHHKDGTMTRLPPRLLTTREKTVLNPLLKKIKQGG